MDRFNPIIYTEPDGLITPDVGDWSLKKYRLLGYYCDIFTSGMKKIWDQLIYIDLFAGAGYSVIRETGKIVRSSALIAMSVPSPFTKYILCESDPQLLSALKYRIEQNFDPHKCDLILGDCNCVIDDIFSYVPQSSPKNRVLTFCFVDPYDLNIKFKTIQALSKKKMDFLILQAYYMDANRNYDNYRNEDSFKISEYLGNNDWRDLFDKNHLRYKGDFVKFLAYEYQEKMYQLGYQKELRMHQIKLPRTNVPLYYLAFYSKNPRGIDFFKKVETRVSSQTSLVFEE